MRDHYSEGEVKKYLLDTFFNDDAIYSFRAPIDNRVNSTISFIHHNLRSITTMKELTKVACLSESRLFHLFKRNWHTDQEIYIVVSHSTCYQTCSGR